MKISKILNGITFLFLTIFLPLAGICQGIEIEAGAVIEVTGAATIEIEDGGIINNGTYTRGTETVTFSGTSNDSVSGNDTDFYNLEITNTGGITTQLGELTSNSITLGTGAVFTIDAGKSVTIEDALTNSGGTFIVQSDASGFGSLIVANSSTGDVNFNSFLTADQWHIVSSPVSTQSINSFLLNVSNAIPDKSGDYGVTDYTEISNIWSSYFTTATAGNFTNGKGYLMRRESTDGNVSFTGTLVFLDKSVDIDRNERGWNAVGNPYSCAIGVTDGATTAANFLTSNISQLDPNYSALYLWDEQADFVGGRFDYKVIGNSGYIDDLNITELNMDYLQAGQGFLAKSKTGGGTLNFTQTMQVHQSATDIVKSAKKSWDGFKIVASKGEQSESAIVTFHDGMTNGLDPSYDAGLFSINPDLSIYTRLVEDDAGVNFKIQALPELSNTETVIPIGLELQAGEAASFFIEGVYMPKGIAIVLEDKVRGSFVDLSPGEASYDFLAEETSAGTGRFFVHVYDSITTSYDLNNVRKKNIAAYFNKQSIIVSGSVVPGSRASLFDLQGRNIGTYNLLDTQRNEIPVSKLKTGIYILVINDGERSYSFKIATN